jgi:hypothetical protein
MPVTQVPWTASSATIAFVNVIKSLVRVAPSALGAVSCGLIPSSLPNVHCTASRRCCVPFTRSDLADELPVRISTVERHLDHALVGGGFERNRASQNRLFRNPRVKARIAELTEERETAARGAISGVGSAQCARKHGIERVADFYQFEPAGELVVRDLRAVAVSLIVAEFHTGKWTVSRPYSGDGKIRRFNGRNRNCRVRGYICPVGLERASLMTPNVLRTPTSSPTNLGRGPEPAPRCRYRLSRLG